MDAEFGQAHWNFAMSTYAFELAERIVCCYVQGGVWQLAQLDTRTKRFDPIKISFTGLSQLRAAPGRAVFLGGSPSEATALVELDLAPGTQRIIPRSAVFGDDVRPYVSVAQPITFPTAGGETAHALYYPPLSNDSPRRLERRRPCWSRATADRPRRPRARCRSRCILDEPRHRRARRELPRQHGIRPSLSAAARAAMGLLDVEDCIHGARHLVESMAPTPSA